MIRLWLVRHGQTDHNAIGRFQGWSDIPLNACGQQQAQDLALRLAPQSWTAVYTSDLRRAMQTTQILLASTPEVALPLSSLRETHFGKCEGLTWEEIGQIYPQACKQWQQDRVNQALPGGESLQRVSDRLGVMLEQTILPHQQGELLLVFHGGTLALLLCKLMGMDLNRFWQWQVDCCSITQVELYPEGAILTTFNDTHHLSL